MSHTLTQMTTSYPPTVTAEVRKGAMFVELIREEGAFTNRVVLSGPPEDVAALCRKIANYAESVASVWAEPDMDAAADDGRSGMSVPERVIQVGAWSLHQMRCLDPVVCRAEPSDQECREARAVIVSVMCDEEARAAFS